MASAGEVYTEADDLMGAERFERVRGNILREAAADKTHRASWAGRIINRVVEIGKNFKAGLDLEMEMSKVGYQSPEELLPEEILETKIFHMGDLMGRSAPNSCHKSNDEGRHHWLVSDPDTASGVRCQCPFCHDFAYNPNLAA